MSHIIEITVQLRCVNCNQPHEKSASPPYDICGPCHSKNIAATRKKNTQRATRVCSGPQLLIEDLGLAAAQGNVVPSVSLPSAAAAAAAGTTQLGYMMYRVKLAVELSRYGLTSILRKLANDEYDDYEPIPWRER